MRATAVTGVGSGLYGVGGETDTEIRVHRKLTLERTVLPPLLQGLELAGGSIIV